MQRSGTVERFGRAQVPTAPPVSKYVVPEIVFGYGALAEIGHAARRLGAARPFLVTDPGIMEAGWVAEAVGHFDDVGLEPVLWSALTPNPKDHEVAAGCEAYRAAGCDVIVVVGGGSCIDAAKGIAVVCSNGGSILDYEGIDQVTRPIPPMVIAPSTAGTGADVSQFAVITDTLRHVKATLIGRALVPDISITDPRLLTTMPDWLAATTGLDALTHGIESYVSRAASFLTDEHALSAVHLVNGNLRRVIDLPEDLAARTGMARASLTAGLAFTNAILGATHAMSHQLGGATDLPHGMLNAVLLPHVMRFNAARVPERFVSIARALGIDTTRIPADEAAELAAETVAELSRSVGAPTRLRDLGIKAEDLPRYAEHTLSDACISTNPRDASITDVIGLFRQAL